MSERIPAEVFPPGEFLREELEARGWIQEDLAAILDRPARLISEIINGKRSITPETARGLGEAFADSSPEYWLNLENLYQLYRVDHEAGAVAKRARLFEKAPVREMIRRGWLEPSDNTEVLESRLLDFFEISSLGDKPPVWKHAARKSTTYSGVTPAQWAWLARARKLSKSIDAKPFTDARFSASLVRLRSLLGSPEEVRHVPGILAEGGVRLVIVQHLMGTKIDGACFWLDRKSPVVALSLRYERIDCFWHSVCHELGHVRSRDGLEGDACPLDIDLVGGHRRAESRPANEQAADEFATNFLVDQERLQDFVDRVSPLYSKALIRGFASLQAVHPGIVVGQLQYREEIPWSHNREMMVPVRNIAAGSTLTDGWGFTAPA